MFRRRRLRPRRSDRRRKKKKTKTRMRTRVRDHPPPTAAITTMKMTIDQRDTVRLAHIRSRCVCAGFTVLDHDMLISPLYISNQSVCTVRVLKCPPFCSTLYVRRVFCNRISCVRVSIDSFSIWVSNFSFEWRRVLSLWIEFRGNDGGNCEENVELTWSSAGYPNFCLLELKIASVRLHPIDYSMSEDGKQLLAK